AATATFSRMDSFRNGRGIWKVRATPRWQIASGVRPPISSPRNLMEPPEGGRAPETQLKQVVLPDPLGPMSPRISPGFTSKVMPWRARNPPKRLVRPETFSTDAATAPAGGKTPDGAAGSA